ncbi:hypothetical protein N0V85_008067 [Neurospora sp. IMI 360204]|nr:hypothetical protein N0V85_008067 [Neurospora sp. IMI 360204]
MPPPLPHRSDESSSEEEASDSGSLHEAAPESDSLQLLRESAMGVLASRLTAQNSGTSGNHVTGKLLNNAKRAPADDFANDHVAKYPKLDQDEEESDEEESDEEESDEEEESSSSDGDDGDEGDEEDEEEGHAIPRQDDLLSQKASHLGHLVIPPQINFLYIQILWA